MQMHRYGKRVLLFALIAALVFLFTGCGSPAAGSPADGSIAAGSSANGAAVSESVPSPTAAIQTAPDEAGAYTTKEDVALYIHVYGHLPDNFITKSQARALGWEGGGLDDYAAGKCIGGDRFGNYEGLLPEADGRTYAECDINTLGADSRGAERIIFSSDGLIYYTADHYESFTLLYGAETP